MKISLGEISEIVSGKLYGNPDTLIRHFHIDSRKYISPEGSVFCALKGERNDGHQYIPDLIERGISSFLVENLPGEIKDGLNFIHVKNCMNAMQLLAGKIRRDYKGKLIGITGSNGKTILKEWIHQAVSTEKKVYRSPESYNSQVGVPLSFFLLEEESEMAVIEAGISRKNEMHKLESIIKPDLGIFTNLGSAHQENFRDLGEKLKEKLILFRDCKKLIYCKDDRLIHETVISLDSKMEKISWGKDKSSDYIVNYIFEKTYCTINLNSKFSNDFRIPFADKASAENATHLIIFLLEEGFKASMIQLALNSLEPVAMRMEIIKGAEGATIINDIYNSDLISLENALDYLNNQDRKRKKTVILSDILQSGKRGKELIDAIIKLVKERGPDKFIGIGETFTKYSKDIPQDWFVYPDTDTFISKLKNHSFRDEIILLKGSRKYSFESVSDLLQEKTHRTIMEINLNALLDNYRFYKGLLKPGTKVMAMVKAFSYGSGGYEIASILQYNKVDYLAVAYVDEGVELRQGGIHLPIMVMNPEKQDFHFLIKYNLEPEIFNMRILKDFKAHLKSHAISSWPVHIKIDTGMHRLGFDDGNPGDFLPELKDGSLKIASVFSHLAAANDPDQDTFTLEQIQLFQNTAKRIAEYTGEEFLCHILNTPGIERFPEAAFDMVRLGIGLYGISEKYKDQLTEVSLFKTTITQIRELDKEDRVGYGRRGILRTKTRVGTLPVGYADGIPRSLGNGKGKFLCGKIEIPTIGDICMDMTMVDLTDTNAMEGDEVVIFGNGFSVTRLAKAMDSISYEVLTGISQRVKRVYLIE